MSAIDQILTKHVLMAPGSSMNGKTYFIGWMNETWMTQLILVEAEFFNHRILVIFSILSVRV